VANFSLAVNESFNRVRKNCLEPVILSAAKNPGIWNQANAEILRRLRLLRMTSAGIFQQPVKGRDGEDKDHVEWFHCVCWNGLGEIAAEYVTKGK